MLKVEGLRAGYGRLIAVDGVDLSVRKGEIVFVVGPNGAGKSTLLKAIVGLRSPFAGSITFQKKRINGIPP
jgi:branched-chain amino acid transport system ATP-binding protein